MHMCDYACHLCVCVSCTVLCSVACTFFIQSFRCVPIWLYMFYTPAQLPQGDQMESGLKNINVESSLGLLTKIKGNFWRKAS